MAIDKYTTIAFIIKHYPDGEDNVMIKLYTKDFGLIFAKSQSLRKSIKLRGHLLENRISMITVVKGKEYFRIAGAVEINSDREITRYITESINRFIHGQEENKDLFSDMEKCLLFCRENKYLNIDMKILILLNLLYKLGYFDFSHTSITEDQYREMNISDKLLFVNLNKNKLRLLIDNSIQKTMM
ncbi:MAG: hypothetical protein QM532_03010 [Cyanobium sp. MAG06]|nr:hypothetical protein [Cyanobium sp. MAG06]